MYLINFVCVGAVPSASSRDRFGVPPPQAHKGCGNCARPESEEEKIDIKNRHRHGRGRKTGYIIYDITKNKGVRLERRGTGLCAFSSLGAIQKVGTQELLRLKDSIGLA